MQLCMCSIRGCCCFLPGVTVQHWGSERLLILEGSPMKSSNIPDHVTFLGWPPVHNHQKPSNGPFFVQHENTAHVHSPEQVNPGSFTCSPSTSLFLSTTRVSNVSAVRNHNPADCQSELELQSIGRRQILVSTSPWLPVVPPPCCQKRLQPSWCNTLKCPHDIVSECLLWFF